LESSKLPLFAREATGLVRRLGLFDQFIVSMSIINITGGFVLTMIAAPFFFPGANMIAVFALGAIPSMAFVITYSILSSAIPRAGGDYVWTGRILSQRLATVMAVVILFGAILAGPAFNAWYFVAFALAQMFFSLGVVTANPGLVSIGATISQPPWGYAISLVFVLVILIIGFFGTETYRRINKYTFTVFLITMVVFPVGLLSVNTSSFISSFDAAMKNYNVTQAAVNQAVSSNPQIATFSLWNTIWYAGWASTYLNTSLALPIAYIIPGFAAMLFPVVKKDLYKKTVKSLPGWLGREIGGVPVLSLGGLAIVLIWGFAIYSLLFPVTSYQYLGASMPIAISLAVGLIVFGLVLFEVSRIYHERKDKIDITLASKEIPPE
jgi:amino acid transporter